MNFDDDVPPLPTSPVKSKVAPQPYAPAPQPKLTASQFLQEADDVMMQRGVTYDKQNGGKSERSMDRTIKAFNEITGRDLKESEGLLLMLLLKQVRQSSTIGYHADSALDSVAYSALLAEALSNES